MFSENLLTDLSSSDGEERFDQILLNRNVRIERIVSHGQASAPGFWYEQGWDEWVLLLKGTAVLGFEGKSCEGRIHLSPGDHVFIPAGQRHRVESTSAQEPAVWLAIHWDQ